MHRRDFLRLAALGAPAVLAACRGLGARPFVAPSPFDAVAGGLPEGTRSGLRVFPGGLELIRGRRQRLAFGLLGPDDLALEDARARAWLARDTEGPILGPFPLRYRRWLRPEALQARGFYEAVVEVPDTDLGVAFVHAVAEKVSLVGTTTFAPLPRPRVPDEGARAVPVATPTFDDARGVANVCTREPPCPMHRARLDRALTSGKPVVFVLGSPALCTSRTCGPVLEEVLAVRRRHGARAAFVHAEPYRGNAATTLSPTAEAWGIESEPWTFVIDRHGIVRARFEGPVVAAEIEPALEPLV